MQGDNAKMRYATQPRHLVRRVVGGSAHHTQSPGTADRNVVTIVRVVPLIVGGGRLARRETLGPIDLHRVGVSGPSS